MTYSLGVKERLLLFQLLPQEGDFTSLRAVRKLREDTALSEQELKDLKFEQIGSSYRWDQHADQPKNIEVTDKAREIVQTAFKRLDETKKLTPDHLDLWDKFFDQVPAEDG